MVEAEALAEPNIANIRDALALACEVRDSERDSESDTEVGPLVDRILKFLRGWNCSTLRRDEDEVTELFRALGFDRAIRCAGWLARRADNWDTFLFWERTVERFCREAEAAEPAPEPAEPPRCVADETDAAQLPITAPTERSYGWLARGVRALPR